MSDKNQNSFMAVIQKEGSFTFIAIPFTPREVWGAKPRYKVKGTINDVPVHGTLGALGQDYFLRLGAAWMQDSGMKLGERVTVQLTLQDPHKDAVV